MTERPTGITISEPITGREDLSDLSRPEQALAQFYRGLNGRDLALLAENWEPSNDAVMDNPLGGIARAGKPSARSTSVCSRAPVASPSSSTTTPFTGPTRSSTRWAASGGASSADPSPIRTTRIFRRVDGRWRQVHHHGSIEDPTQLGAYRQAVSPAPR